MTTTTPTTLPLWTLARLVLKTNWDKNKMMRNTVNEYWHLAQHCLINYRPCKRSQEMNIESRVSQGRLRAVRMLEVWEKQARNNNKLTLTSWSVVLWPCYLLHGGEHYKASWLANPELYHCCHVITFPRVKGRAESFVSGGDYSSHKLLYNKHT